MIQLGISTFGETTPLEDGSEYSHAERIRQLIKEIELADKVGLDVYAIGEHHRKDFAVSVPEILLAAGAVNTKNIQLSSAVNVLSSSDPIRLYQNYATINALSNNRAELMVGRGSFTESFPLFGYDLRNYDELFEEKLAMLLKINENEYLTWSGKFTPNVLQKGVYPRSEQPLSIWVGTGGNPESTIRIANLDLPIAYAVIGGNPLAFKKLIQLYRDISMQRENKNIKVSIHSWGYIAEDKNQAIEDYFLPTKKVVDAIAKDRLHWSPMNKIQYLEMIGKNGAMVVGDAKTVAEKIIYLVENLNVDRFLLHLPIGTMSHEKILTAIRIYGEEVAPIVREYFKNK